MRGRSRGKGPNPLTRTYESNGPDVKIRGTAQHVADKYAQLARDATASGDPVAAENYLQHAEHYYRLIAAAQETYRQQFGTQQRPFDDEGDEGDEDGPATNGFAYPGADRGMQMQGGDDFGDGMPGQPYEMRGGGDRPQGGRFDRGDRQDRGERQDRGDRQDRGYERGGERQDRGYERGNDRQDRQQRFDRPPERPERNGYDRNGGPGRPQGGERFDRNGAGHGPNGERHNRQDRPEGQERRERFGRGEGREGGRGDFNRNERGQPRPEGARFSPPAEDAEVAGGGLPAFLTTPVRAPVAFGTDESVEAVPAVPAFTGDPELAGDVNGAAEPRQRRPRRPRRAEPAEVLDFEGGGEPDKSGE
jgi:hypothetical protein